MMLCHMFARRSFPDLTENDRLEVDTRLHGLMEKLDKIRNSLKVMYYEELTTSHHQQHLHNIRTELDSIENDSMSDINGVKVFGWSGMSYIHYSINLSEYTTVHCIY